MEMQKTPNSQSSLEKEEWSWKNQYCENDYTTKCNLQIQCDPYQITNGIFQRTGTKKLKKNCMETLKGSQIANSFFRKKNRARGIRLHVIKLYYKATVIKTETQINETGLKIQK